MSLTFNELSNAIHNAFLLAISFDKIDTFVFRKGALLETNAEQRKQLIKASAIFLKAHPILESIIKNHIDASEMSSSLYHNFPHRFRGAYKGVIVKTFAGLMAATI